MSSEVVKIEDLLSHYEGVLQQSEEVRSVIQSWGLNSLKELRDVRTERRKLLERLGRGDVEF